MLTYFLIFLGGLMVGYFVATIQHGYSLRRKGENPTKHTGA